MTDAPKASAPDDEAVKAMAVEDALDAAQKLRDNWGNFGHPLVPVLEHPASKFQERAAAAADWTPEQRRIYLDRFCARLGDEDAICVLDFWTARLYAVDCALWPEYPATLGQLNYTGKMAGWL